MPSPFPGMNPYLENRSAWHDFHESFIPAIREDIASLLDSRFVVRIDDHVYIHELSAEERRLVGRADVGISSTESARKVGGGLAILDAPEQVCFTAIDVERVSFVEIRDRDSWDIVTVIEVLSPSNKNHGPDREQYLGKRGQILQNPTHLVEIDLLRGGPRLPLERVPSCDYCVLVSRWQQRPHAGFWPIHLRDRLPTIPIPLTEKFPDVALDLQSLLHRVYDAARYGNYIYRFEPEPPLEAADQLWAKSLLTNAR